MSTKKLGFRNIPPAEYTTCKRQLHGRTVAICCESVCPSRGAKEGSRKLHQHQHTHIVSPTKGSWEDPYLQIPLRNSGVELLSLCPGLLYKTTLSTAFTFFLFALKSPIDGHELPYQREGFRNSKRLMDLVLITQKVRG